MKRREFIRNTTLAAGALLLSPLQKLMAMPDTDFTKADFGPDFKWGVAAAAHQIEGAWDEDGKGETIWNRFEHKRPGKIKNRENADVACDFYHRYREDIPLVKEMNMQVFRFSTAWARIFPKGTGEVNQKGIDFYNRVIDRCLEIGIEPWLTLYHWDLPQALQDRGGWGNRDIVSWFSEYADRVTREYGDRVKNWMVLNEPMAFTAVGHLMAMHAPGKMAPALFLKTAHHATMAQAEGGRVIRNNVKDANVGTTFSCMDVQPKTEAQRHVNAAHRMNILLNRLYIEPCLGMGYPDENFPYIHKIYKHVKDGDMEKVKFDFDFIGLQNYTRLVVRHFLIPIVWANQVKPQHRGIATDQITDMGWEVYPEGIYKIIKQFAAYPNVPPIIVTENGAAFPDTLTNDRIHDTARIQFFKDYLSNVLKAKKEGVDIRGYFVWTLMDNFEWAEGYKPRFGLVYVDYKTQQRYIKDSGLWFKEFLKD